MLKKLKRTITLIVTTLLVFTSTVILTPEVAEASIKDTYGFNGSMCTSNGYAASRIDYNILKYPYGSTYPGSGTCWGYAETISNSLGSSFNTKYYTGVTSTSKRLIKLLNGCKAGTHLRISNNKSFQGNSGHSVVILKFSTADDLVVWTDNNGNAGYNKVGYYCGSVDFFCLRYTAYGYINMVKKPTSYKIFSEPLLKATSDNEGVILSWLKTSGASKYNIYRSTSKSGTYSKIATITKAGQYSYIDTMDNPGKTYYYKVKALKSDSSITSSVASAKLELKKPVVTKSYNYDNKTITISWKPVKGATSYIIYKDNWEYIKKVKTTTSTSYTIKDFDNIDHISYYSVKAYSSKLKQSSDETFIQARFTAPEVTNAKITKNADGSETISWDPVDLGNNTHAPVIYNFSCYYPDDYWLELIETTKQTSYTYFPDTSERFQYVISTGICTGDNISDILFSDGIVLDR